MGDPAEGADTEVATNGASNSFADARAAFLAGDTGDPAPKADKSTAREVAEDDSDLDDEDAKDEDLDDARDADEEDDDSDLDDDDKEAAKDDDEEKPDADTAKRLSQVQRTEKRMREQLKKERAQMESEIQAKVDEYRRGLDAEIEKWKPRIEATERFERLKGRADILGLLKAAEFPEEAYAHAGQILYTLSQAKGDDEKAQKARLAVASLTKQREVDDELAELKKWRTDREKTEKEREQQAAADKEIDSFISTVTKAASDKTPLAKTLLKNDPDAARDELQIVAFKLAKEQGKLPDAKAVMIAFEKHQRAKLRKLGIDPKSRGAAAALTEDSKTTTTSKKNDKKTEKATAKADDKKLSPRDAFIRGEKFD